MSEFPDQPSGSLPAGSSAHQEAATVAAAHLDAAVAALSPAYDHPHFAGEVARIRQHLTSLADIIRSLPVREEQRAEHTARVMEKYRTRQLGAVIPQHDEDALRWELERTGQA